MASLKASPSSSIAAPTIPTVTALTTSALPPTRKNVGSSWLIYNKSPMLSTIPISRRSSTAWWRKVLRSIRRGDASRRRSGHRRSLDLSMLKTPMYREWLEIFAPPTYRGGHDHDDFPLLFRCSRSAFVAAPAWNLNSSRFGIRSPSCGVSAKAGFSLSASVGQARAALTAATADRSHVYAGVRAEEIAALSAEIAKAKSRLT